MKHYVNLYKYTHFKRVHYKFKSNNKHITKWKCEQKYNQYLTKELIMMNNIPIVGSNTHREHNTTLFLNLF